MMPWANGTHNEIHSSSFFSPSVCTSEIVIRKQIFALYDENKIDNKLGGVRKKKYSFWAPLRFEQNIDHRSLFTIDTKIKYKISLDFLIEIRVACVPSARKRKHHH